MPKPIKIIKILFGFIRCLPHLLIFLTHSKRQIIQADIRKWKKELKIPYPLLISFIYLMSLHRAYRNVFYYRTGIWQYFLNFLCPKISSLMIVTENIGEGLFIWHGYGTAIGAKSIGKNCMINHHVTIGAKDGSPTLLDNVTINPGAIIFGDITVGNNSIIGSNTTVYKNVPDNSTVFIDSSRVYKRSVMSRNID